MSQETKLAEYLKRVTAELYDTRARLREALRPDADPVAVVGMACRYPGGADTPDALWELLSQGKHAITDFPADRGWDTAALYDPDPQAPPGTTYVRTGGFLDTAAGFDAGFFGIAPREAIVMDPQHRILLETAWHALEDAGIDPAALRGTDAGVFAGIQVGDYHVNLAEIPPDLIGQISISNAASVASGRIAYLLGTHGPALSVDTACSSSLVAVHLAAQSLHRGECGLALAGGAAVTSTPARFIEFSQQRALAPDGLIKPFSADADGTSWSEGAGVVVLEKLSRARARGHRVLAVLRGSGINHDGPSNGLTAPNRHAQERLIRDTLERAGLTGDDVDAVEAHGTGTTLGDPIEAQALAATYGAGRQRPLYLGSSKGNLGHAQAAAGIAGVVKTVLALRHGLLPPIAGFSRPTPHVDWDGTALHPLAEATAWPETGGRPRRMAVSAFGMSGTNAHLILEEPPAPGEPDAPAESSGGAADDDAPRVLPLTLSATSPAALAAQARSLRGHLDGLGAKAGVADVAYVLARRTHHPHRAVVLCDREGGFAGLDALAEGTASPRVVLGHAGADGGVAFLFPGQGSEWPGMGRELLRTSRVFRETIAACEDALSEVVGWSLGAVLRGEDGAPPQQRPDVLQPTLLAMMAGLAEMWRSRGVRPAAVTGHSQGEIAAAWLAGALTLPDAMRVSALRSRLFTELSGLGAMASVGLSAEEAAGLLTPRLEIAAVNGPRSTVVSGDPGELAGLLAECERLAVRARRLPIGYAAHSRQVESIRDRLLEGLAGIRARAATVPYVSGVTGDWHDTAAEPLDAAYWYRNLREPVRFDRAVGTLLGAGHLKLIEVSPHPVLLPAVRERLDADGIRAAALGTLRRDEGGPERWTAALAEAHVAGVAVDWPAALAGAGGRRIDLPGYAFQRERYWLNSALPRMDGRPAQAGPGPETAGALLRRLSALAPAEREEALAELIAGHVAVVLRYPSAQAVPREDTFRDLGFESLNAVDLRNRLGAATGFELQLADVLNYPTVTDLAEFLGTRLAELDPAALDASAAAAEPGAGDGTLSALYLVGVRAGRGAAATELIRAAGGLRSAFEAGITAPMYRIAEGTGPTLVCTTAPVAPMTDAAYGFFAAALPRPRPLWMMRPPGFEPGEPVPADRAALVRSQERALLDNAELDRIVLVGYSSGGWLAHALAAHLEAAGRPAGALVLFDYYPYASGSNELRGEFMREQAGRWPAGPDGADRALDTQLGAMGAYQSLFADWQPGEIATPILHVAAADAVPGRPAPAPRDRFEPPCHRVVTLPGSHLNMLSEHAEAAARTVHDWLAEVL
jgi:candicidin polyketide synthase FscB